MKMDSAKSLNRETKKVTTKKLSPKLNKKACWITFSFWVNTVKAINVDNTVRRA